MVSSTAYIRRVVDDVIAERLTRIGAVLIEGAKGCGKTETARQHAASHILLDIDEAARETAAIAPMNILEGATPRLLDEWQLVPGIWNAVRRAVDARHADGQFILTGSATPADDLTRHAGAGRFSRLKMRTLTLAESGLSSKDISLASLIDGQPIQSSGTPPCLAVITASEHAYTRPDGVVVIPLATLTA